MKLDAEARAALEELLAKWRDEKLEAGRTGRTRQLEGERTASAFSEGWASCSGRYASELYDALSRMEVEPEPAGYRTGRVSFSPEAWHGMGFCRQEGCTCAAGEELL